MIIRYLKFKGLKFEFEMNLWGYYREIIQLLRNITNNKLLTVGDGSMLTAKCEVKAK